MAREYNSQGQAIKESLPYFDGATALWHTFAYDVLGRPTAITTADGTTTSTTYDGNTTTITDALGQQQQQQKDSQGRLRKTIDALGTVTTYQYDSEGNLTQVIVDTADQAHTTTNQYDLLGRKTQMTTPEQGNGQYKKGNNTSSPSRKTICT